MKQNETQKRDLILTALIANPSVTAAAKSAKVGRATVYRYMNDKAFSFELKEKRTLLMDSALDCVRGCSLKAVETLYALMDTEDERLRRLVCKDIIDYAFKITEIQEIKLRLEKIESLLGGKNEKI